MSIYRTLALRQARAGPNIPFNLPIIQNFILQFLPHYSRENHLLFLKKLTKMQMKHECDQNVHVHYGQQVDYMQI